MSELQNILGKAFTKHLNRFLNSYKRISVHSIISSIHGPRTDERKMGVKKGPVVGDRKFKKVGYRKFLEKPNLGSN